MRMHRMQRVIGDWSFIPQCCSDDSRSVQILLRVVGNDDHALQRVKFQPTARQIVKFQNSTAAKALAAAASIIQGRGRLLRGRLVIRPCLVAATSVRFAIARLTLAQGARAYPAPKWAGYDRDDQKERKYAAKHVFTCFNYTTVRRMSNRIRIPLTAGSPNFLIKVGHPTRRWLSKVPAVHRDTTNSLDNTFAGR